MAEESKAMVFSGVEVVLQRIPYRGIATTYTVDYRVDVVAVIAPASGPTLSLGTSTFNTTTHVAGDKTVTVAAGGANKAGYIIVAAGKSGN